MVLFAKLITIEKISSFIPSLLQSHFCRFSKRILAWFLFADFQLTNTEPLSRAIVGHH